MDNPGTLATFGIQDIWRRPTNKIQRHNTTKNTKKISNTDLTKNWGWTQVHAKA